MSQDFFQIAQDWLSSHSGGAFTYTDLEERFGEPAASELVSLMERENWIESLELSEFSDAELNVLGYDRDSVEEQYVDPNERFFRVRYFFRPTDPMKENRHREVKMTAKKDAFRLQMDKKLSSLMKDGAKENDRKKIYDRIWNRVARLNEKRFVKLSQSAFGKKATVKEVVDAVYQTLVEKEEFVKPFDPEKFKEELTSFGEMVKGTCPEETAEAHEEIANELTTSGEENKEGVEKKLDDLKKMNEEKISDTELNDMISNAFSDGGTVENSVFNTIVSESDDEWDGEEGLLTKPRVQRVFLSIPGFPQDYFKKLRYGDNHDEDGRVMDDALNASPKRTATALLSIPEFKRAAIRWASKTRNASVGGPNAPEEKDPWMRRKAIKEIESILAKYSKQTDLDDFDLTRIQNLKKRLLVLKKDERKQESE